MIITNSIMYYYLEMISPGLSGVILAASRIIDVPTADITYV